MAIFRARMQHLTVVGDVNFAISCEKYFISDQLDFILSWAGRTKNPQKITILETS
jgi:hypothetical protein